MKRLFYTIVLLSVISCKNDTESTISQNITNPADYETYLNLDEQSKVDELKTEVAQIKQEANGDSTRISLYSRIAGKLDIRLSAFLNWCCFIYKAERILLELSAL